MNSLLSAKKSSNLFECVHFLFYSMALFKSICFILLIFAADGFQSTHECVSCSLLLSFHCQVIYMIFIWQRTIQTTQNNHLKLPLSFQLCKHATQQKSKILSAFHLMCYPSNFLICFTYFWFSRIMFIVIIKVH